jgi:large subunit ribosomal protein L7Ae
MAEIDEKQVFSIVQKANENGTIRVGANETTKAVERGQAKLVVTATDVTPPEIIAHFPGLCKEMKTPCVNIGSRAELGSAAGIKSTSALAVVDAGSAKKELEALSKEFFSGSDSAQTEAEESAEKQEAAE